ncbi:hypothetical protein M1V99_00010 (plasmid) [Enterobacter bugandensis]|uniref:hypothetical protein n=1 Tax=Enterobacter bugandensis TaxID=881260 RepID=UPI0020195A5A|nr:hypothetical protein [Enterobacter bugandensis]UQQ28785.1 hypothetical protein M1V99_00010 [Enterobacter bugandensis]
MTSMNIQEACNAKLQMLLAGLLRIIIRLTNIMIRIVVILRLDGAVLAPEILGLEGAVESEDFVRMLEGRISPEISFG